MSRFLNGTARGSRQCHLADEYGTNQQVSKKKLTDGRFVEQVALVVQELCDGLHRVVDEAVLLEVLDTFARLLTEQPHTMFLEKKNYCYLTTNRIKLISSTSTKPATLDKKQYSKVV